MKKIFAFCLVILALLVGACTRPASPSVTTVADTTSYPGADGLQPGVDATAVPAGEQPSSAGVAPAVTATQPVVVELTQAQPPAGAASQPDAKAPTATPLPSKPTSTPLAPVDQNLPTSTPTAGPSPTPTFVGVAFDPRIELGKPTIDDPLETGSKNFWVRPEDGVLPNTTSFQIEIKDNKFYVTGKQMGFSTWWFSWPSLKDFYIELEANSKTCEGKDSYGLILRGPEHDAGLSYGYVVALSCDGNYWVFRLDGVDPWRATTLVDWKASNLIRTGNNQLNVLGVRMEGDKITVFINGQSVAEVQDDEYSGGRYGLFVRPDSSLSYTFQGLNLASWDLAKVTPVPTAKP